MKLCKICSVSVSCTGYGKRRLEISALIPITTNSRVDSSIKMLMPGIPTVSSDIKTGREDLKRFITLPLVYCLTPPVLYFLGKRLTDIPQRDLRMLTLVSFIPLIWLVIVKTAAAFRTSVGFDDGYCTLSYCSFYRFHKTVFKTDRISKIVVVQDPLQKLSRTCHLYIYTCSEGTQRHAVKGLNYKKLIGVLEENGYSI
jgi:putative membrane protein